MAKSRKLLLYLAVIALLLWGFWLVMERPSVTAVGTLHRTERRELRKESTFLDAPFLLRVMRTGRGYIRYHVAVGKTDEELYLAEAVQRGLFWYSEEDLVTVPLTEPVTAVFQPWCAEFHHVGVLVYTPLDFDHGYATVTVGRFGFTQELDATETELMIVQFPDLGNDPVFDEIRQQIQWRQYDLRSIGYDESQKTIDVTLKVVLYDSANKEIARVVREYPAD